MAVDGAGLPHVVWQADTTLYHVHAGHTGGDWAPPAPLAAGQRAALAMEPAGAAFHLAWASAAWPYEVYHARCAGWADYAPRPLVFTGTISLDEIGTGWAGVALSLWGVTGAGEAYALLATTVSDAAGRYVLTTTLTGYDLYRVGAHPATDAAGLARAWSWSAGASCGAGVEAALCFEAPPPGRYAENHFLYRERAAGLTVNACASYTIPEVEMTTWVAHSPYPAAHYAPEVVVVTKYYYHGGRRVALRVAGDPEPARNGLFYLHLDHLGSTSSTTDEQRNVTAEQRYYPYGAPRQSTGDLRTDYGFTGQRRDAATTLMYYGARYYDPALGRFVSADTMVPEPGNPQSLNRYAYVLDNPLKYTDPSGNDGELNEFLQGILAQYQYDSLWWNPVLQKSLAVREDESVAKKIGRSVGNSIAQTQGLAEMVVGGGVSGGGAVVALAGVPASAGGSVAIGGSVTVLGGTLVVHGAGTYLTAMTQDSLLLARGSRWKVGDPPNKPDIDGNNPDWSTVRERYWKNRAHNAPSSEFGPQNIGRMKKGLAPQVRIIARMRDTGEEVEMLVSKELHHIIGRGGEDPHALGNLMELWPWEHASRDPSRYLDYDFVRFR